MKASSLISAMLFMVSSLYAQQPTEDEMTKAWNAFKTPGEVHKMMATWDGTWIADITMWMEPGAEPMKSKGECTNRMLLGGRYQEGVNKGTFMGMPMEGLSTLAWDNAKKIFVSTWIDNFGTGIMFMEGPWEAATNTIKLYGKQTDPMTGKDMKVRQAVQIVDANTQKMEMWIDYAGKEFKTMEIVYKRK